MWKAPVVIRRAKEDDLTGDEPPLSLPVLYSASALAMAAEPESLRRGGVLGVSLGLACLVTGLGAGLGFAAGAANVRAGLETLAAAGAAVVAAAAGSTRFIMERIADDKESIHTNMKTKTQKRSAYSAL